MRRSHSLLLLVLVLAGCSWFARFKPEPTVLPFPEPPALRFVLCDTDKVCLSQADGAKLSAWMDKLKAFQAARLRLLQEP